MAEKFQPLSERWTREVLRRCQPRELLIIVGAYGIQQVARRLGLSDVEEFAKKMEEERANVA